MPETYEQVITERDRLALEVAKWRDACLGARIQQQVAENGQRRAEAENAKLREVLEFYADAETYVAIGFFPDPPPAVTSLMILVP